MSKELIKPYVELIGNSANDVTGSCYKVAYKNYVGLIEYGGVQTGDILNDYKINHTKPRQISPKNIDFVIACHIHQDHVQNIPYLYKMGCNANLYVPKNSKKIMQIMWMDCVKIFESDAEKITKKNKIKANPLYDEKDIITTMAHVIECDFGEFVEINRNVRFKFYHSNHIINSAQLLLELHDNVCVKRIHYTSDLGSLTFDNYYIEPFEKVEKSNIAIVESTYATDTRSNKKSDRPKDIEKIDCLINQIKENKGKIIVPVFSLNRSQDLLTLLYETYHNDPNFNIPIIFDAPLANKVSDIWEDVITKNQNLWDKVWNWDKVVKVNDWVNSVEWQNKKEPMLVLASGGFLSGGRAVAWTKQCLGDDKNYMCFVGYGGDSNSSVYKIKHGDEYPTIKIDGTVVQNKANVICLNSFSSHIDNDNMLEYYGNLNCQKIILVHGDKERRLNFAPILREQISKNNKTTKILVGVQGMKIYL
jgi:metallo-beta-lactamase family protein